MIIYTRTVQPCEVATLGLVHHSAHIFWMEESRLEFLHKLGTDHEQLAQLGLYMPVLALECQYLTGCTAGEQVDIHIQLQRFGKVRFSFGYRIYIHGTDKLLATATTTHSFLDADGRAVPLYRQHPQLAAKFEKMKGV